ncbi:MAG: IclR family transcriptional regulator [Solirubrobacteraceae bacterium]
MTTGSNERPGQVGKGAAQYPQALISEDNSGRMSQSLERGIKLLLAYSEGSQLMGVAELADLVGFSRPTTHRYASTLVQLGYLEQGRRRKYRLAPRAADPGTKIIQELCQALPADDALRDLRTKTGYTVSMGTLDRTRVLYVRRFFGHRRGQHMIDHSLRVGAVIPAYCTALGKAMLANLPEDERHKMVTTMDLIPEGPNSIVEHDTLLAELDEIDPQAPLVSDEEFVTGARSIAIFIARRGRTPPIAIDVTVPSEAYTAAQLLEEIGPKLVGAAELIAKPHAD